MIGKTGAHLSGSIIQTIESTLINTYRKKDAQVVFCYTLLFREQAKLALEAIKCAFFYYIFLLRTFVRDPISRFY